jgi:uncharacterized protein (DUF302 family)
MRRFPMLAVVVALALIAAVTTTDAFARSDGIVAKPSAYSVKETMDRLERILKAKGFTVYARIDHGAAARSINQGMAPAEVLIFGMPKISTPLMQSNINIGIDLPLKALAYQEPDGQIYLTYNHPGYLVRRHEINDMNRLVSAISRILANLTDDAVQKQ